MDTAHSCLELLEILLQTLQLICRFVICSDGLIDDAEGANDEFQSDSNKSHYASREAEWVHNRSDGLSGAIGLKSRENDHISKAQQTRRLMKLACLNIASRSQ